MDKIIKEIEELLNSDVTDYRISKDTGITLSVIQNYRNGKYALENMTLKIAKKLYEYKRETTKENRKMLKLSFRYKGKVKEAYSDSLDGAANEAFEYFKNDEHANEVYNQGPEAFIKDFLNGEVEYVGEEIEYFKNIPNVCDLSFLQIKDFINRLEPELKEHIKKDEFNDEYYIEYNSGAYQLADQLEQLAEELYF